MKIIDYEPKYEDEAREFIDKIKFSELGWTRPVSPNFIKKFEKEKSHMWLMLDEDEEIIGTIGIIDMGKGRGYLKRMYLAKEYRGTGAAQEMFNCLLNYACDKDISEIYLGTMPNAERAIAFYKKNNFIEIDRLPADFDDGNDEFFMKLVI